MRAEGVSNAIMVLRVDITPFAKQAVQEMSDSFRLEHFKESELLVDVSDDGDDDNSSNKDIVSLQYERLRVQHFMTSFRLFVCCVDYPASAGARSSSPDAQRKVRAAQTIQVAAVSVA